MKKSMKPGELYNKYKDAHSKDAMKGLKKFINEEQKEKMKKNKVESKKHESKETKKHEKGESKKVEKKENKMKKNWIAGAIKKPGALRKSLGVKKGQKIPAGKLAKAAKKGGKMGKRARLAETLKSFKAKKK